MKYRKAPAKENHERWLVSYADLVTLLFAFFVVMFASTQTDHGRARAISEAVTKALKQGATAPRIAAILGGAPDDIGRGNNMLKGPAIRKPDAQPEPELLDLATAMRQLRSRLASEVASGAVEVRIERRGVVIGLNSAIFFALGDDTVAAPAYPLLDQVAQVLSRLPNAVRLEGHTDALPINNARFRSNWELSAARGIAMLRLLNERYGVPRERMAVVGYADTLASGSNDTVEGRRQNRRVDIVIVSDSGLRLEPQPNSPAGAAR